AISLVNLVGVKRPEWKEQIPTSPTPLSSLRVAVQGVERPIAGLWLASPDGEALEPQALEFTLENGVLSFQVPSLAYWDLVVIKWSK
ncbi:MAG: hypothetical protein EHM70_01860, partial [Chloroflexota bacterium]